MLIQVSLKNVPIDPKSGFPANKWQMSVFDWGITQYIGWGIIEHDNIAETAIFDIPAGWMFPLRIDIIISYQWQENSEWISRQVYRVQSWAEGFAEYKEIFIDNYGSYYYNVATEQFEKIAEPIFSEFTIKDYSKV